ncbi:uncharacterized protein ATNIH1004_009076 [Aspergillus tanneri]|uniref:Trafficking protein particle complex subunit 2-like protein n=1 Tax=Aspergillus tanneri TaxID=1220188 RepID=A0A5M9MQL9_9EURO|nr:uncharacterized protein ATNIH1004_009076 [Aspergillus tanneri]KAA8644867.1 hypothetical protein ATNIH1004_009076 [Aspergillus tanneri]
METIRTSQPKIACISDNPLHTSLFPPYQNSSIEFSFLLNSCLDVFEIRQKQTSVDQDLGLLHAIDERLAAYGWLTTTGVKLLVIVDLMGQAETFETGNQKVPPRNDLKESDLRPVFRALQLAYIQLLQNPFYSPNVYTPIVRAAGSAYDSLPITDPKFTREVKRIGDSWGRGSALL